MHASGARRAFVASAGPADVAHIVPGLSTEMLKEASHVSTVGTTSSAGRSTKPGPVSVTTGVPRPRLPLSAVVPGDGGPSGATAHGTSLLRAPRRAGCCRTVTRALCCACTCGWCCGRSEDQPADEPTTPPAGGDASKRFLSVRSMIRSADFAEDGTVTIEVPLALARVARRQHGLPPEGADTAMTFVVPFGPVLRPGGDVFVPSPADKRRLRLGGALSRVLFMLLAPGFALDAFLLVPPLMHIAGVSDVFQPGNPSPMVVALRVMRLARAFKLLRYTPGSHQLLAVAHGKMEALMTSLVICFSFAIMLASAVFAAEYTTNPDFSSMISAMWFAAVTVTTGEDRPAAPAARLPPAAHPGYCSAGLLLPRTRALLASPRSSQWGTATSCR